MRQSAQGPCPKTIEIFKNKSKDRSDFLLKVNTIYFFTHTHYTLFSHSSFCHLRPQIVKARRGGRRGKVTAVITDDDIVVVTDDIVFLIERD